MNIIIPEKEAVTQPQAIENTAYSLQVLIAWATARSIYYLEIDQKITSLRHAAVASAFIRLLNIDIRKKGELLMFHVGAGVYIIDSEETGIVVLSPDVFPSGWLYVEHDHDGKRTQYHFSEIVIIDIQENESLEMERTF